jgi:hypothetical protein
MVSHWSRSGKLRAHMNLATSRWKPG